MSQHRSRPHHPFARTRNAFLLIALAASLTSAGHAQNSLQNDLGGSNGNILDNNLQRNSSGTRMRQNIRNYQQDYRLGNLAVTGGLAGGRNFRVDAEAREAGLEEGFYGVNDFRGQLGGDDLFNELQGSALSQIQFVTSDLANQSYMNASGLGMFEYRRDHTPTEGIYNSFQGSRINQDRIRLDRTYSTMGGANLYDMAANPSSIRFAEMQSDGGDRIPVVIESNNIQGVYTRRLMFPGINYGTLDTFQRASLLGSVARGELASEDVGSPYLSPLSSVPTELLLNPDFGNTMAQQRDGAFEQNENLDAYEKAIRQMINTYADRDDVTLGVDPVLLDEIRTDMDRLRRIAMEINPDEMDPDGFDLDSYIESLDESETSEVEVEPEAPAGETSKERDERLEREDREMFIERSLEMIQNGGSIDSFLEGQEGRIRTLMEKGEMLLRRGAFFDAEQRFDEILTINPGNPLALLGRATSQLGAGLYLSTAFSLRKLFTNYPEMAGMVLDDQFQPNELRLRIAEQKIRKRIERQTDLPSYGLCLAYIGRLLEKPEMIQDGLVLMDETDGDRFLSGFLEKIWLDDESPVTDP